MFSFDDGWIELKCPHCGYIRGFVLDKRWVGETIIKTCTAPIDRRGDDAGCGRRFAVKVDIEPRITYFTVHYQEVP